MEKNREAELKLPDAIIQHIQSFLDGKEAAQTTLLSRSWYKAWLTRPNLDFDQKHFANKSAHDFWKFVNTTVERYEKLNIKIDSLRLWIHKEHSLVNGLIVRALQAGATRLDFRIQPIQSFLDRNERIEPGLELPEAIIQHIQSFLDGKEAAQTTLLSRSWYQAWLTRPNLDFDQEHFSRETLHDFWELVKTTVKRYERLNTKIDSFKLWFNFQDDAFVNKLIIKTLKFGATCFDFKIHWIDSCFSFPNEVFEFETLTRLSVRGCKIGVAKDEDNERLLRKCSGLKCLTLELVMSRDNNVIWDIASSCPLIENFSLSFINVGWPVSFIRKQCLSRVFHSLKRLYLYKVRFDPSFFGGFDFKFPCLVDLTLHDCSKGCTDIKISSPSLECILLYSKDIIRRAKFDVPRIRKFTLSVPNIPLLSFGKTNTSNWRSNIHIKCEIAPSASWFGQLASLLKKLRSSDSEVVLSLYMWSMKPSVCVRKLRGLHNKPEVFHMTINGPYGALPDFYSSLFKICRPGCIEPYTISRDQFVKEFVWKCLHRGIGEFFWKRKIQEACLDSCIEYQKMGVCDLRKVEVDFYDESISRRCTQLVDTTSTTSIIRNAADDEQILFNLKWGPKSIRPSLFFLTMFVCRMYCI